MKIFKLINKNYTVSYDFILFVLKENEIILEIAIVKHAYVVCWIISYHLIADLNSFN